MTSPEAILNSLCAEGKEITIGVTIKDRDLAAKFMDTMYGHNLDQFGVTVNTWGNFNIEKAYQIRETLIAVEMARHAERMAYLNDPNLLKQLLDE